jgi:hypothetical protein
MNKTWKLTPFPSNRNPINLKWVFKNKINVDATIDKYKARLVARCYSQVQKVGYRETFFPVVKLNSIKVFITLTTQHNIEMQKLDVKTTFLNGYFEEDIYMNIPTFTNLTLVCKLTKSLNELKQTSCALSQP